ncbi:MAG TPA: hypothetical protein VFC84_19050 [Desulfosporosinus sp.]|nr:hypothetical protein [Desulfosporosinus sp.]
MSNETELKIDEIKEAATKFKDTLASLTKDMKIETDSWRFSVESQKDAVKVDVAFSVTIKKKEQSE